MITLKDEGFGRVEVGLDKLGKLTSPESIHSLLEDIGALVESQTRRRISDEKRTPDQAAWKPWGDAYKQTRHSGHSLLVDTGSMRDTIQYVMGDRMVVVGSNMEYAPAVNAIRPFLGIGSPGSISRNEIQDLIQALAEDAVKP